MAGVFKSTDAGATWTAANAGLTNLGINALAVNPATPTTLYAGTGDGVFKSTDSGETWAAASAGSRTRRLALAINPAAPDTLYAGTGGAGVFRSTDGGTHGPRSARACPASTLRTTPEVLVSSLALDPTGVTTSMPASLSACGS